MERDGSEISFPERPEEWQAGFHYRESEWNLAAE